MKNILQSWIGTPFRYRGYTKEGCDCVGLILGILQEVSIDVNSLLEKYLNHDVGRAKYIDATKIFSCLDNRFKKSNIQDANIGDIVVLNSSSGNILHLGMISRQEPKYFIHADIRVGNVVEVIMDRRILDKLLYVYSLY